MYPPFSTLISRSLGINTYLSLRIISIFTKWEGIEGWNKKTHLTLTRHNLLHFFSEIFFVILLLVPPLPLHLVHIDVPTIPLSLHSEHGMVSVWKSLIFFCRKERDRMV
jgi:hypothetical protein